MVNVFKKPRIFLACLAGIVMVASALINTPKSTADNIPNESLEVVTGEAPDRGFITITDKNNDGIPDWQAALANAESLPTLTSTSSAHKEPETLTESFALDFTEDIMLSRLYGTIEKNQPLLIEEAAKNITEQTLPTAYTEEDLFIIENTDSASLRNYGNAITAISFKHTVPPDTREDLTIIEDATLTDNPEILDELNPLIENYEKILQDTLSTPVPKNMSSSHLDLVNGYLIFITNLKGIKQLFDDPLTGLVHTQRFLIDKQNLGNAVVETYLKLYQLGVRFDETDITNQFIRIE